jgi:sugar/nucleoside kinase (ribokinase family)
LASRFLVVGDVIDDIVAVQAGPLRSDTDTAATIRQLPGGSAANTATWLASLGADVAFAGAVGAADLIRHAAAMPGVEARLVATDLPTGAIVVLVDGQRRSMLTSRGANAALDLAAIDIEGFDHLHLTGHPLLQSVDGGAAFIDLIARAKAGGLTVSLDPGSAGFIDDFGVARFLAAIEGVDILLPSLDEGRLLTGLDDPAEIVAALPFPTVVLTAGADGAYAPRHIPAVALDVVDPTGAGDAFAAGFLAAFDGDAEAAAGAAVAVAARAVATLGGRP